MEKDFMYLLEYDAAVKNYLEQPLKIQYQDSTGKRFEHTPDFIIDYFDGTPTKLVEIKYQSTLKSQKKELQERVKATRMFCQTHGLEFSIITESFIREEKETELLNYKFLERYRNFFENINKKESAYPVFNTDVAILRNKMKILKTATVQNLISNISEDKDKQAELIFLTWFMVSNRFFIADLSKKLTLNSMICLR
ncbi:Tn7 transposase TnsA N-terminal domain-containing protein [Chryseobacterium sp. G0186]|uniref:Tn7 transposase TnsA N-terminal domain-containing protein n=1 Tax=Chryseobacterium sp. G0186 TaxID=2487064 RepID=UPI001E505F33|nr:Tn7 transposase TnsA N-terminal domain-containing protein [Chryseobacterium sp. G0186]